MGGVSSARNIGLNKASGEYVYFVDSDDFVERNMFETIYKLREDADIIVTDFYVNTRKTEIYKTQAVDLDLTTSIFEGKMFGALWNKFLKRSIIVDSNLRFHEELDFCEDICFLCELQQRIYRKLIIKHIDKAFYHYCLTESSLTRRSGFKQIQSWNKYIALISIILKDNPQLEYYILTNKFDVKWFSLQSDINFPDYQKNYPDIYDTMQTSGGKKKISFVKRYILIISKCRLGFHMMRFLLKVIKH